jgi:DNA polymerase sigma
MENQDDFIPFDLESQQHSDSTDDNTEKQMLSVDILTPLKTPPWVPPTGDYPPDLIDMLNQEITEYIIYISPTNEEHTMRFFILNNNIRKLTLSRLEKVIKDTFPNSEMKVFGSFETKLYLPSSDLDVVVIDDSLWAPNCLRLLEKALLKSDTTSRIEGRLQNLIFSDFKSKSSNYKNC